MTALERAEKFLEEATDAYSKALKAQEYETAGNKKTMADVKTLKEDMLFWENRVKTLKSGRKPGARLVSFTPKG